MAFSLRGNSEEDREASWSSFEKRVETILKEKNNIHLDQLLKLILGGYTLLTDYQGILEGLKLLTKEGKIIK